MTLTNVLISLIALVLMLAVWSAQGPDDASPELRRARKRFRRLDRMVWRTLLWDMPIVAAKARMKAFVARILRRKVSAEYVANVERKHREMNELFEALDEARAELSRLEG